MTERKLKNGLIQLIADGAIVGAVGTVKKCIQTGLFEWCDYRGDLWACIPIDRHKAIQFGTTKEEAVRRCFGGADNG